MLYEIQTDDDDLEDLQYCNYENDNQWIYIKSPYFEIKYLKKKLLYDFYHRLYK